MIILISIRSIMIIFFYLKMDISTQGW